MCLDFIIGVILKWLSRDGRGAFDASRTDRRVSVSLSQSRAESLL